MSSNRVPSRVEVMGWSPQQLADYLRRMSLSGCDKAVLKNSISGARFVNMSDNDLQRFPKLHAPMISKISTEISKKEERRGLFDPQHLNIMNQDDEEFDDDYESPYSGDEDGSGGDYESPNDDLDGANDYEPPPSEPPEDLAHKLCPTLPIGDSDYIVPPGPPQIFRGNKPGRDCGSNPSPVRGPHRNSDKVDTPDLPAWSKPPALPPSSSPSSVGRSNSSVRPFATRFDGRREHRNTTPSRCTIKVFHRGPDSPGCRHATETVCLSVFPLQSLTNCTLDGAYLVRDSTRQLANQPFTLMVFYQDKVYNIQIRQQNQQFLLGTGLKVQESALLLIDAKNRSSSQQNQCLLSDPAGYYMTGHN
ncbi:hypothetical protein PAMP_006524 [Pampus punctatissimus]